MPEPAHRLDGRSGAVHLREHLEALYVADVSGKIGGAVNLTTTYTNSFVIKANKVEGFTK